MKTIRKLILLAIVVLLSFTLYLPTFAFEIEERNNVSDHINPLKDSIVLPEKDVIKIADFYIDYFVENSPEYVGHKLSCTGQLIELFDINDNIFAYIIKFEDENSNEVGCITVGAIEDGVPMYNISLNIFDYERLGMSLKQPEKSKVIFLPPNDYIIKDLKGNYSNVFNQSDISELIKTNITKIEATYRNIRNSKNRDSISKILSIDDTLKILEYDLFFASDEIVELDNCLMGEFVPVYDNDDEYYGGDQDWYTDNTKKSRGCGPVAAANITAYFALKAPQQYGDFYAPSNLSRPNFITHMNTLYNWVDPTAIGEPSVSGFASDIEGYTYYVNDLDPGLDRVTNTQDITLENTSNYIKNGLNTDSPVACLNLQLLGYDYGKHWMTITRYVKFGSDDSRYITVSTWGEKKFINYGSWYNSTVIWGGGLIYFE